MESKNAEDEVIHGHFNIILPEIPFHVAEEVIPFISFPQNPGSEPKSAKTMP
jgi:hypothetical protein